MLSTGVFLRWRRKGEPEIGCLPARTRLGPEHHFRHIPDIISGIAFLALIRESKALLDNRFHPDGYNIGINVGNAAGQTVMHLHIHIIPRYAGDVEDPRGGVRGAIPEKRRYWKS